MERPLPEVFPGQPSIQPLEPTAVDPEAAAVLHPRGLPRDAHEGPARPEPLTYRSTQTLRGSHGQDQTV